MAPYEKNRMELIAGWLSKYNIKSVLDIGSVGTLNGFVKEKYVSVDVENGADYKIDLNKIERLPFVNNSFDCVVLSQILEHLFYPQKILKEAVRISREYIIIGLPHDFSLDLRFKALLGRNWRPIYDEFGQKGLLHKKDYEKFIKSKEYGLIEIEKKNLFGLKGDRFLPKQLKAFLIQWNLFCRNFYVLYRKR